MWRMGGQREYVLRFKQQAQAACAYQYDRTEIECIVAEAALEWRRAADTAGVVYKHVGVPELARAVRGGCQRQVVRQKDSRLSGEWGKKLP